MGLVISTQDVIQSAKPRSVISQINADVLALLDTRYLLTDFSNGENVDKITLHGNEKQEYRYLRKSTNANNSNAPILQNNSLFFDGNASLRTNAFNPINTEFTCAMVLKLDKSKGGVFLKIGAVNDAQSSKNILYSASTNQFMFRKVSTPLVSIPADGILEEYFTVIITASETESKMLINDHFDTGLGAGLILEYYQLMSGDHSTDKVVGNLKYFSLYDGAATKDEMLKLQQILKQNFNL